MLIRYNFTPDSIIHFDETDITINLNTPKVLANKTHRHVGQIVSAERGDFVSFRVIVTGIGHTVPPVFMLLLCTI